MKFFGSTYPNGKLNLRSITSISATLNRLLVFICLMTLPDSIQASTMEVRSNNDMELSFSHSTASCFVDHELTSACFSSEIRIDETEYRGEETNAPLDITGSTLTLTSGGTITEGTTGSMTFQVFNNSFDQEYIYEIELTLPSGWTLACNSQDATDSGGNAVNATCFAASNVVTYTGEDAALGEIVDGQAWNFTIDVTVPGGTSAGNYDFSYILTGDGFGAAPHTVSNTVSGGITVLASGGTGADCTYRDEFNTVSYSNSDGTENWSPNPWIEVDANGNGDDINGPTGISTAFNTGYAIYVATAGDYGFSICPNGNGCLYFNTITVGLGSYVSRQFDLTGATTASLSFNLNLFAFDIDQLDLQVRTGGGGWTTLDSYTVATGAGLKVYNLDSYIASDTEIRFIIVGNAGGDFGIDNLQVEYDCSSGAGTTFPDATYTIDEGGSINTCTGTFADSGDSNGDYGDSESHTMTFCSDQNNQISFTFEHFNTEPSNDVLSIYDGNSTGAPLIGSYSGTGSANSPGVVTSSGTCLTFGFTSNGSTTAPGWLASISCTGLPPSTAMAGTWTGYPTSSACALSTEVGGTVYEDIDNDGIQDTREPGVFGVTVTLFDDNGQVGSSTTTDASGAYSFTGLTAATVYRVEFTIPDILFEGPFGSSSATAVQFIESGRCNANLGLADAAHYCDDNNPYFVIPCFVIGDPQHGSNAGSTGIARFRYSDSGNSPAATYENYVTIDAVGTTWGVAYNSEADRLYMSSVLKRHSGLGPNGIGAIYYHNDGDPNTSAPVFYDFGTVAGTVDNNSIRFPGTGSAFGEEGPCGTCDNIDPTTFAQVGKVGFGDIDVNPENTKLYVTNLYDRKIYTIDLNSPSPGSATPLPGIPWLDNSPCSNGIARPWGLEFRRGKLYVGVVCDASSSSCTPGSPCSDLTGIIYSFDGTNWTNELSFPFDYYRQSYATGSDYFVKWIDDWNTMAPYVENITDANFAQPVIMDIEFDDDNSIIIGIGDRTGFQLGYQAPPPPGPSGSIAERNMAFGDILRASYDNTTGTFTLESNGVAGSLASTNPNSSSGPGGKSFYWGDYWTGVGANTYQGGVGGLMLLPGSGEVAFPLADAIDYYSNGISWMSNTNGSDIKRLEVYQGSADGNSPLFAKGSGVGDMVLFCNSRPLEIGNVVWWDDDLDGLQDPSEPGINGVTVELLKWNGSNYVKVAETTTDTYGQYVFSQDGNSNGLSTEDWSFTADNAVLPNTQYQIRITSWNTDTGISTYSVSLGYTGILISPADSQGATGDERDSDAIDSSGDAIITLNTGDFGNNNHSYDFAFGGVGGCVAPDVVPTANTPCEGETLNLMASSTGGVLPYTFNWSGPNSFTSTLQNPSITNTDSLLNSGMYYLTVTDDAGCVDTTHIHVAINKLSINALATDASCGVSNGQIDLTISVGFSPFTIDWDNDGTGDNDDDEDLTGLGAGTYNVTVTDSDGCSASTSASVGSAGSVTLAETHIDETCTVSNGSIDLTITGIFTTIDWDNDGTGDNDDMEDLSGLSAGTYSVTVNNAINCPATLSVTLTNTPGPSAFATQVNTTCGTSNGSINLTVNGGVAPYSFDWDNDGTGDNDDTEDLSGLAAGTYNATVTDATGCTVTVMVTLTNTPGPMLSATPTDETCGNANGSIDLMVSGGAIPYTFLWNNGLTTENISGLGAGTFNVTVTDANGCTATTMATVNNTDGPTLTVIPVDATDCNSNDGSIDLTITGGSMPFQIDWDNDGTGDNDDMEDLGGLTSGTYMVIVTDNNGCQALIGTTILNGADPVLSTSITDPTTCAETGSIDLTVTGGSGPFTYDWSNDGLGDNDDMEDISGLPGGVYTVVVTGSDGCSAQANASILVLRDPVITGTVVQPDCGMANGSITLSISDQDGGGPYTFDWDNDGTGDNDDPQNLTGLASGNYTVVLTNNISCTATATFSLSPTAAPTLTSLQVNPTCNGSNGSIDLVVSGGSTPYSFDWDNDGTGDNDDMEDLSGLSAGTYNVTVIDNMGCEASTAVTLNSTIPPVLNASVTPETCTTSDGVIDLMISGIAPYSFDWDNDGTGDNDDMEDISGLSAGTYNVTVTDANGCTASNSFIVGTFNIEPTVSLNDPSDECIDGSDMSFTGMPTNANGVFSTTAGTGFTDNGDGTANLDVSAAGAGTYDVTYTYTDGNGCVGSQTVNVTILAAAVANNAELALCDDGTGNATFNLTDAEDATATSNLASGMGQDVDGGVTATVTYHTASPATGANQIANPTMYTASNGSTVVALVTLGNGCSNEAIVTLTVFGLPSIAFTKVDDTDCTNPNSGSINITASGGAGGYVYDWADIAGTNDIEDRSGLAAGDYMVTITDANGCTQTETITILAAECVAVGNYVFMDVNNNGIYEMGTDMPIGGVVLELYNSGDMPGTDTPVAITSTSGTGYYYFDNLNAGDYFVYIPSSNFGSGQPLENKQSYPGADSGDTIDSNDNGSDTPVNGGISSNTFTLTPDNEPIGEDQTDYPGTLDDDNVNGTIDFTFQGLFDYGDLPDGTVATSTGDYTTLAANGGPAHAIVSNLFIGFTVDSDSDGQPDVEAGTDNISGDDGDGSDDEDGVDLSGITFKPGNMVAIPVVLTNNTGNTATLYAFVDWNNDGDFDDTGEVTTVSINSQAGSQIVLASFQIPDVNSGTAVASTVGARFRLTTGILTVPTWEGIANDGEVEDYILNIMCPTQDCFGIDINTSNN